MSESEHKNEKDETLISAVFETSEIDLCLARAGWCWRFEGFLPYHVVASHAMSGQIISIDLSAKFDFDENPLSEAKSLATFEVFKKVANFNWEYLGPVENAK
jgi:hypothetical protein